MKDFQMVNEYTALVDGEEMDTSSVKFTNFIVGEHANRAIIEAVRHFTKFSRARVCCSEDDSRFFYNKEDLDKFVDLFNAHHGNWEKVKCRVLKNEFNEFFCYEIYREENYRNVTRALRNVRHNV